MKLKLFVWESDGFLESYTSGMACILAKDLDQAYKLAKEKYDFDWYSRALKEFEPKIIEEPEAFIISGGD